VHFQIAQPNLADFAEPAENHAEAAAALRACDYAGWLAIEMREQATDPLGATEAAVCVVLKLYGGEPVTSC
jgi:hypothetical protein